MRISGYTKNYVEITIPIEEVEAMLNCDEEALYPLVINVLSF
jgi:hypothetical protein